MSYNIKSLTFGGMGSIVSIRLGIYRNNSDVMGLVTKVPDSSNRDINSGA
jgi:hypothetical protein